MIVGVLGGIFPDFDFIYHIFVDSARTPHHSYLTHMPFFWISTWLVLTLFAWMRKSRFFYALSTLFCLNALLHLGLDTLTGVIYWFSPLSHKGINVFKVADIHLWWVQNFTYHWTFLFEVFIVATALIVFLRVKETFSDIFALFRQNRKLRAVSIRLSICALGIALVALIASMKFSIDNRAMDKVIKLKRSLLSSIRS
jgi:hypothetical protein